MGFVKPYHTSVLHHTTCYTLLMPENTANFQSESVTHTPVPQPEITQENTRESATPQQSTPKHFPLMKLLSVAVLLLVIAGAGYFALQTMPAGINDQSAMNDQSDDVSLDTNPSADTSANIPQGNPQLFFLKDPGKDSGISPEGWLINPDGTNVDQVELPKFDDVYKNPYQQKLFLTQVTEDYSSTTLLIKDLETGETATHALFSHPNPEVIENIQLLNPSAVAPDSSAVVYSVFFTEPCPERPPLPSGFEGGYGPCVPDMDPAIPEGTYVYNVKTGENTHIGGTVGVSRWDVANDLLYFIDHTYNENGLYSFNLTTKERTLVYKASTFGFGAYPLFSSNKMVLIEGTTGDMPGEESMSQVSILDRDTNEKTIIATESWAQFQPFASLSPDESKFIYYETPHRSDGHTLGVLYLYDLESGESKRLTPESQLDRFSRNGHWIDNTSFITLVETLETDDYYNGNNYLVNINTQTGEITRITPNNDVYRF